MKYGKYTGLLAAAVMAVQVALCVMTVTGDEEIPLHWDARGNADDYGSAGQVWLLPLMSLLVLLLLVFFKRHPERCHWPREFNDVPEGRRLLAGLVGWVRLLVLLFLTYIVYEIYRDEGFHYLVAGLFLVALFMPPKSILAELPNAPILKSKVTKVTWPTNLGWLSRVT